MLKILLLPFLYCSPRFFSSALGALGSAGAFSGLASGLLGGVGSIYQAKQAQASAKAQMNFQRRMSNTAHQREIKDLKAAGLNPILSAKYGGASTPAGAGFQVPNIGAAIMDSAHSAAGIRQATATTEKTGEETKNVPKTGDVLKAQLRQLQAQVTSLEAQARNYNYNSAKSSAETLNIEKQNEIMDRAVNASKIEAEIDETQFGKAMRYLNRLNPFGNSAKGLWTVPQAR